MIGKSLRAKWVEKLQRRLAARGYEITRVEADDPRAFDVDPDAAPVKLSERVARRNAGGRFESPEERVLEMAAAHFIADARRIACVGQGTGVFESFVSVDAALEITGVVGDGEALEWCREHRASPNVTFVGRDSEALVEEDGEFDLALLLGVIDQTADFGGLLAEVARLSPRAVISAANRRRDRRVFAQGPLPGEGVRHRWSAGEFYWVLRAHYAEVALYGLADPCVPRLERVNLFSELPVLYAVCSK